MESKHENVDARVHLRDINMISLSKFRFPQGTMSFKQTCCFDLNPFYLTVAMNASQEHLNKGMSAR